MQMKMFSFDKKVFVLELARSSSSIAGALNFVSMNNQECKVRPEIVDVVVLTLYFILLVLK